VLVGINLLREGLDLPEVSLVAAKNLNRQFIGIEKEKEYYDICLERLL
jgi:excinuclease UvrABC helicase subunit UvrB